MDRIDGATLFVINILLLLAIAVYFWGFGALLMAALIGTPIVLGCIIMLSLTAKA
jgi:hypothetical protein